MAHLVSLGQPYKSEENWKNIEMISQFMREKGSTYTPAAAKTLDDITEKYLQAHISKHFSEIAKGGRERERR